MQRSSQAQYGIATTPGGVAGPSRGRGPWIQWMERLVDVSFHQDMTGDGRSQNTILQESKHHPVRTGWWFGTMEFYDCPYMGFLGKCHHPN